jgi:hypothetical protein
LVAAAVLYGVRAERQRAAARATDPEHPSPSAAHAPFAANVIPATDPVATDPRPVATNPQPVATDPPVASAPRSAATDPIAPHPTAPPRGPPRTPTSPRTAPSCDPPFTVDATGVKIPKRECLSPR